jgi:gamma-glutamylcyclotransferase (GGCT)/AIG2-like uncharacterized protein YtfP
MASLYFAYGTNMSPTQMASRCPGASLVDRAVLRRHRFIFNAHGYGTVVPDASADVHGVVWSIEPGDEQALDEYEAVAEGLYRKERRMVEVSEGERRRTVDGLIYVASDSTQGVALIEHLQQILIGAEQHRLPDGYIRELRRWHPA